MLVGQRHFGEMLRQIATRSVSEENRMSPYLAYASGYDVTPKWRCPTNIRLPLRNKPKRHEWLERRGRE